MKKIRNFAFALLTVSLVMVISGTVCSFVVSLSADREETQKRMVVVNDSFDDFNESVSGFELERDTLYTESLSNIYYDSLANDDAVFKNKLNNYESIVDTIVKKVKTMDGLCNDVYYPDSSVNSKCSNYKLIYEQVINYFMNDVNLYNGAIKTFNDQQASVGSTLKLEEYKTTKKYVDYNNDGVFEGKEVE